MGRRIISLLFLVMAVAIFWGWTRSQLSMLDGLRAQKGAYDKVLAETRELQSLRDNLLAKYNSITPDNLSRLFKIVPDKAETTKLMVEITNIASEKGVIVKRFYSQEEQIEKNVSHVIVSKYNVLSLSFDFAATYEGMRSFLKSLEESLRLIDITEISFLSSDSNLYEFNIKAKAYYKR